MVVACLTPAAMAAFSSDVTILEKSEIVKLTDAQLTDTYINTLVEIEANRAFHATSGFSSREFKEFKELLKYRIMLLMEIHSRNLEVPQFDR